MAAKSKTQTKTAGAAKRAAAPAQPASEEDHIDGCSCEIHDHEATPDAELPQARGGVATATGKRGR